MWVSRYGYLVGGSQDYVWFWVRDTYDPNGKSWATRFHTAEGAKAAAQDSVEGAKVLSPHLSFRIAYEKVA